MRGIFSGRHQHPERGGGGTLTRVPLERREGSGTARSGARTDPGSAATGGSEQPAERSDAGAVAVPDPALCGCKGKRWGTWPSQPLYAGNGGVAVSATWGGLTADRLHGRDDGQDAGPVEPEPEAGRWQEELDYGVVADTSMTLPGQGEEGPNCGVWKPAEFCDECAEVNYAPNRCERRSCPNCVGAWTRQRAVGATTRLQGARWAEDDGIDRRAVHAVVSPPEGDVRTLQHVYDGFRDAYRLAEEKGVRGGVAVFHGFRVLEDVQEEFREADPEMGIWRWIRTERPENWRDLTYWSPHYHIIGLCRDFEADDPDEQDGWVARRIRSLDPMTSLNDRGPYNDAVGLVRYLMSHATFEAGTSRDCVRWFGDLATTKFQPEEELSDGALEAIERITEEVVGAGDDRADEGDPRDDEPEPCEECGARSRSPIWEAGAALLDSGWCDRIGKQRERRLTVAFEWAIGEREPPPGMKRPQSEEQAREAFEELL